MLLTERETLKAVIAGLKTDLVRLTAELRETKKDLEHTRQVLVLKHQDYRDLAEQLELATLYLKAGQ